MRGIALSVRRLYQAETNVCGVDFVSNLLFSPMVLNTFHFPLSFRWEDLRCLYSLSQDRRRGTLLKRRHFRVQTVA